MAFFDLTEPAYTNRSLNCTSEDSDPSGFCLTEDGLILFMAGRFSETIYKYTLSEAFDPDSATYASQSYDVGPLFANPSTDQLCGIRCNADASWLVVSILDVDGGAFQYPTFRSLLMTTPGDLTTASSQGTADDNAVIGTQTPANEITYGFDMTADGVQFVQTSENDTAATFDSDAAFVPRDGVSNKEISITVLSSYDRSTEIIGTTMTEVHNVKWDFTGNNLFYCGNGGVHKVHAKAGTRAWAQDIDINYNDNIQYAPDKWWLDEIDEITTAVYDLWVSDTGSSMMLLGDNGFIYDYALTLESPQFSLSQYVYKREIPANLLVNEYNANSGRTFQTMFGWSFGNNGNLIVACCAEGSAHYPTRFDLAKPYDLANPTFHSTVSTALSYINVPTFIGNGSALVGGNNAPGSGVRNYAVLTPFDLTTLDISYTLQDSDELTGVTGDLKKLFWSQDGLIMAHVAAFGSQGFHVYRLTTPHDASTIISGSRRLIKSTINEEDAVNENPDYMVVAQHLSKVDKWRAGGRFLSIHSNVLYPFLQQYLYEDEVDDHWRYEEHVNHEEIVDKVGYLIRAAQFNSSYTVLTLGIQTGGFEEIQFPDLTIDQATKVIVTSEEPRDAGWLVMDTKLQVTLLNQTSVTQEVTILNGPTSSVTITGFGVGTQIVAGGTLGFFVTIPKDILPNVDLTFTVTFDNSVFQTVFSFLYENIAVWGFGHQWNMPIEQVCEWATALIRSTDKSEQRRKLRAFPKITQRLSHAALNAERQRLFNLVTFAPEFPTAVPLWMFEYQLTAALSVSDTRIYLDNSDGRFQTGGLIAFYNEIIIDEVSEIVDATADPTYIDIAAEGVTIAHASGKRVYPAGIYAMEKRFNYQTVTDKVGRLITTFESLRKNWVHEALDPLSVSYQPPSFSAPVPVFDLATYRGDLEPVAVNTVSFTHDSVANFPLVESRYATAELVEQHLWQVSGQAEVKQFLEWLTHIAGRYRSFWFIPERHDFTVIASIPPATTTNAVTIRDSLLSRTYDSSKGNLDIAIETYEQDGLDKFYYRSITAITLTDTDESKLSIDTMIHASIELTVVNIKKVTIMRYTRFESDSIVLKWITPTIVEAKVGLLFRTY